MLSLYRITGYISCHSVYLQRGQTPLHQASEKGKLPTVKYLIEECGAEVGVRDKVSQRDGAGCGCIDVTDDE